MGHRSRAVVPGELLALALVLTVVAACAGRRAPTVAPTASPPPAPPAATTPAPAEPDCPPCLDPASPRIVAAYAAAVEAARYPEPQKISRDLVPLLPTTEGLEWDDQGRVRLVTWTKARYYSDGDKYTPGKSFPLYGDTWLMPVPFVQQFCQALGLDGPMLTLRLEQLIGLPPGDGEDAFLEIWVDPARVFRPCPDPEISDHECQVEIPVTGRGDQRPWDCGLKQQVSGDFVTVHPGHLRWMCDNWTESYGSDDPLENYPWTALGYTYDWGNPEDPVGMSEYVVPGGSEVVFHSLTSTEEYCTREPMFP